MVICYIKSIHWKIIHQTSNMKIYIECFVPVSPDVGCKLDITCHTGVVSTKLHKSTFA